MSSICASEISAAPKATKISATKSAGIFSWSNCAAEISAAQRHPVFYVALSVNGSEISEAIQIGKILINFNSTF